MILIGSTEWNEYFLEKGDSKDTVQLGGLNPLISESNLADGRHLFLDYLEKPIITDNILLIPTSCESIEGLKGNFHSVISNNLKCWRLIKKKNIKFWYFKSESAVIRKFDTSKTIFVGVNKGLEI